VADLPVLVVVDFGHDAGPRPRRFPVGLCRQLPRLLDQPRKAERLLRPEFELAPGRQCAAWQPAGEAAARQEQSLEQAAPAVIDGGQG
jgi:hypothetical protein